MAKAGKNLILYGVSGKIGDQIVIRQRGGETIITQAPGKRTGEPTEAQKKHQEQFQQAIIYGKAAIADEATKEEYQEKAEGMKTAFNVAVADFLHAPQIDEIDVTNYAGNKGDTIRVRATDDFKVVQVHIEIYNSDGSLVEEGDAVQQENGLDWIYTCTVDNTDTSGDKIVVKASDKPGNIATGEEIIS